MEFTDIISKNRINAYKKHGIESVNDLQNFLPRKYNDYSKESVICPENDGKNILIIGTVLSCEQSESQKGTSYWKAKLTDGRNYLTVFWFGWFDYHKSGIGKAVVCGKLKYHDGFYTISNPDVYESASCADLFKKVMPVYKKLDGISEEALKTAIDMSLSGEFNTFLHEDLKRSRGYLGHDKAIKALHNPKSIKEVDLAKESLAYEDIYTYLSELNKENEGHFSNRTSFDNKKVKTYIDSLPFKLTSSQEFAYTDMLLKIRNGMRVNALIQGDVGSGKTVVAFMLMAGINYKCVLMAPTVILARQHYEAFKPIADLIGKKVVFISSTSKTKKEDIDNADVVIGTHGVVNLEYENLGLIITDEEHRFGVECREKLNKRGIHRVSMSATPIPRTLADSLYNNLISVYDLELPSERKKVKTYYLNDFESICKNIEYVLNKGDQVYVVCPKIEEDETIQSVEEMYSAYKKRLNTSIACITGKTKKDEVERIMNSFKDGEIKVLIATTVIEVGVNVPNANLIVIHNAERFGLSQLHQLRGRVGRGNHQGFCILESKENTPRIEVMLKTTNGFEIAEEDLKLRGAGDLLGTEQSGKNEIVDLIIKYPDIYKMVKEDIA